MTTTKEALADFSIEGMREKLNANLGDRPDRIPCTNDPDHPMRIIDAGYLAQGGIRYLPCKPCQQLRRFSRCGIPPRLMAAKVNGFKATTPAQENVVKQVTDWIQSHRDRSRDRETFMLLAGKPGTGKSHLAAASLKALGGGWMTTPADIFELRSISFRNPKADDPLPRAKAARCLVLDEIGIGGDRADAPEVWSKIIDHRHQHRLATVMVSNSDAQTILERINVPGVEDRIRTDSIVCTFNWQSFR